MRKHVKALALGGIVALVLSGCMKLDMNLELQSDDTIDGSMIIAVSRQLAELSGTDPAELAEQMRDEALSGDEMPEGSEVEVYEDDEFVGSEVTFEGADLDTFAEDDSLRITRDGDDFVVAGEMDLSDSGMEGLDLTSSVDIRVAITFPGAVADHNGELDGRTVTWVAEPGEVTTFSARGAAEAGALGALAGSMLWIVVGGVAALVIIGLIVFLVVRSRRRTAAPAGATAYSTDAPAYSTDASGAPSAPTAFQPATPTQQAAPDAGGYPTQPVTPDQGGSPTQPVTPDQGGYPTQPLDQPAPGHDEPGSRPQA